MIIGACYIELYIPESNSLKTKRKVIKSIKDRTRQRFNVAIAEVEMQDLWQRAMLGVVAVSNEKNQIEAILAKVVSFIEHTDLAILTQYKVEIL